MRGSTPKNRHSGTSAEQLARLHHFPVDLAERWSTHPLSPQSLAKLAEEARTLQFRISALRSLPSPSAQAYQRARRAWEGAGRNPLGMDRPDIRCLCRHPHTALDPAWVLSLVKAEGLVLRRNWFEGLLSAYLSHWRTMAKAEALEDALWKLIRTTAATRPWAPFLKDELYPFLGPEAPENWLASVPEPLAGLAWLMDHWSLSWTQGLGPALLAVAIRRWCKDWLRPDAFPSPEARLERLQAGLELLARESALPPACLVSPLSQLILSEASRQSPEVRRALIRFVLQHPGLGDPRDRGPLWVTMGAARTHLQGWMVP